METELERKVKWLRGLKNKAWEPEDYADIADICEAALTRAPQWLPIDSAPRDGTEILAYVPYGGGFITQTHWKRLDFGGGLWFVESGEICPSYWQPLPAPPEVG